MGASALQWLNVAYEALVSAPWLKLAYSAVLLSLMTALLSEVVRVWSAPPVFLGDIRYYTEGEADPGRGEVLRRQVLHAHRLLTQRLKKENERRGGDQSAPAGTQPWIPGGDTQIGGRGVRFADVELTVQGVNLSQLTETVRRRIVAPNEITGSFSRVEDGVNGAIDWPLAPQRADGDPHTATHFEVSGAKHDAEIAFETACSLIWIEAAGQPSNNLNQVLRSEFCRYADAFTTFFVLRRHLEDGGPSSTDLKALQSARGTVDRVIAGGSAYPEFFRLRADLISIDPAATDEDRQLAEADRDLYRRLLDGRTLKQARLEQIEATRTADEGVETPEATSASVSVQALLALKRFGDSVGVVRSENTYSTGFVVGPDLVATANFVVQPPFASKEVVDDSAAKSVKFVLTNKVGAKSAQVFQVAEVIDPRDQTPQGRDQLGAVLLRVPGLSGAAHALPLGAASPTRLSSLAIVGFGGGSAKSIRYGRVVDYDADRSLLAYDIPTSPGDSGAPIIDVDSQEVVGMHRGTIPSRNLKDAFFLGSDFKAFLSETISAEAGEPSAGD